MCAIIMNIPNRSQIFLLYRALLKYGEQLKFTDKEFYSKRIKSEFNKNKSLNDPEQILKAYQVKKRI